MKCKSLNVWKKDDTRGLNKFMKGLEPALGEIAIPKKYPSGFFGTDLKTRLTLLGVHTVAICGVSTSGCVRATELDAIQYGYSPMVSCPLAHLLEQNITTNCCYSDCRQIVADACGDRSPKIHNANTFDVNAKMGDAIDGDEAITLFNVLKR